MDKFNTVYAFIRKSSSHTNANLLRPKYNDQLEELRIDLSNTYYPGGQTKMLFSVQKRKAREPISLPMDVRVDMARSGTMGSVLFLLDSCEEMTTDIENWAKFRVEFLKLEV